MSTLRPPRLSAGGEIRVLAPSRSLAALRSYSGFGDADVGLATRRLEGLGLRVSFGAHVMESSGSLVASVEARIDDLHAAFRDDSVRAILAVTGGIGAIQLLDRIDYDLARSHPKPVIGYSDIGYLHLAFLACSGLVGYYGPNFSGFACVKGFERSREWFRECLFSARPIDLIPSETWSDDNWIKDQENRTFRPNDGFWCIQEGSSEGPIVGGSVHCLNALQGTPYFPDLDGSILFLESPGDGKASLMVIDTALRTLAMQGGFMDVGGLVLGRFPASALIEQRALQGIVGSIEPLRSLPVLANVDFGHTTPTMTIAIGGRCRMVSAPDSSRLTLLEH